MVEQVLNPHHLIPELPVYTISPVTPTTKGDTFCPNGPERCLLQRKERHRIQLRNRRSKGRAESFPDGSQAFRNRNAKWILVFKRSSWFFLLAQLPVEIFSFSHKERHHLLFKKLSQAASMWKTSYVLQTRVKKTFWLFYNVPSLRSSVIDQLVKQLLCLIPRII